MLNPKFQDVFMLDNLRKAGTKYNNNKIRNDSSDSDY